MLTGTSGNWLRRGGWLRRRRGPATATAYLALGVAAALADPPPRPPVTRQGGSPR